MKPTKTTGARYEHVVEQAQKDVERIKALTCQSCGSPMSLFVEAFHSMGVSVDKGIRIFNGTWNYVPTACWHLECDSCTTAPNTYPGDLEPWIADEIRELVNAAVEE